MGLTTERLILRPWRESDAESLYEYAKDPLVGPIAGWPVHTNVENSREIIRLVLSAEGTFAVCRKEDDRAIGSIGFVPPNTTMPAAGPGEREIGYWLGVPFWGRGYIPEAVRAMQEYAFRELGCTGLWCAHYEGNERSKKCMEKCGFRYHHTEKEKPCTLMGEIRTEHYAFLAKEAWEQMNKNCVLYVHGKGGSPSEAEHYQALFPDLDVIGFDYHGDTPWDCADEFREKAEELLKRCRKIILIANSIGAFFSMHALDEKEIEKAYLISPMVDMERLITDMMSWAGVTEEELKTKGSIETSFGETLSYRYLTYVREHPITWKVPTDILYGSGDHLVSFETMSRFAGRIGASLTVLEGGEHWFHTEEQMAFLDRWIRNEND